MDQLALRALIAEKNHDGHRRYLEDNNKKTVETAWSKMLEIGIMFH